MTTANGSTTTLETRAFQAATTKTPRGAPMSAPRQRLTTVGEVVLDGLLTGVVAVAVVAVVGAAALALTVVLLAWWY